MSVSGSNLNRKMLLSLFAVLGLAIVTVGPGQSRAATPTLTTLVSFNGTNGGNPRAGLISDANGYLFSTTSFFGAYGYGTVYEIAKTAGGYASTPTTLVSFCSQANCIDGAVSRAGLISDPNGNLFGTTGAGGSYGGGTVFEVAKTAGGYASTSTTLVSFCSQANCTDGYAPFAGLIADANGNLFGTTELGGAYGAAYGGYGTVFEIGKSAGGYASTPTILVSFNLTEGVFPQAGLIADANGNLLGTTAAGGAYGYGTVFEIAKTAGGYASTPTTLVSFNLTDGAEPIAGLTTDANGNLFGTTAVGGAYGYGTVFEIAKTAGGYAGTPTTLVSFCSQANCTDGANPNAGLTADANGNLFGTTAFGGVYGAAYSGYGTVFEIAKTAGGFASAPIILVSFDSTDGQNPVAGLIADADGNLFGTTLSGAAGYGTVFEIAGSGFVVPVTFAGTPGKPNCHGKSVSALAQLYGGLNAAATALGFSSVAALQDAIMAFCGE